MSEEAEDDTVIISEEEGSRDLVLFVPQVLYIYIIHCVCDALTWCPDL